MFSMAYRRIFQGLLLVLLDFRIQYLDILPDFLGYILIFCALSTLAAQHSFFSKARPFALLLVFLSLGSIIETPKANLLEFSLSTQELGWLLLEQGKIIVDLFLFYWLCQGIQELAQERALAVLQEKARFRWRFYFTVTCILLVYAPFALNLEPSWNILMIPILVLLFAAMLLLLGLVRTAQHELKD